MFSLFYSTFTSEYVYAVFVCFFFCKRIWLRWFMEFFLKLLCLRGYMEFFANAYVHGVMRSYGWCYLCFLRDLRLRDLFLFFVFLVYGLIRLVWQALSVKIEALVKQVSADSVAGR